MNHVLDSVRVVCCMLHVSGFNMGINHFHLQPHTLCMLSRLRIQTLSILPIGLFRAPSVLLS